MASPSDPPRRKGLNLANPGGKEYLIVGGITLALALAYFWWKGRQTAAVAPAADSSGTSAPATPTGLSTADLMAWIHDHQSSTRTTTTNGPPAPPKAAGKTTVPNVTGKQYAEAAKLLKAADLNPARAEADVGQVQDQFPKAGKKVARGSIVVLSGTGKARMVAQPESQAA